MTSAMRRTMAGQPEELRRLLSDTAQVERAAQRLSGRRLFLVGTGTSWHAANHGEWFLRTLGLEARAVQAADAALYGPAPAEGDGLLLLSHTGAKRYTSDVLARARADGVECVSVSARGVDGTDVETVDPEDSSAYTASHLGALLRLAQIAQLLAGAELGQLDAVPDVVRTALDGEGPGVEPPARLLEFTGSGANQWTAAEGALKVREAAYVAAEGLPAEQLFHGPSVALAEGDTLVALDGGGPGAQRLAGVAGAIGRFGARVHHVRAPELGEPLSVFPLTVAVQRVALECAEALGTNPDQFRYDAQPGRETAWESVGF